MNIAHCIENKHYGSQGENDGRKSERIVKKRMSGWKNDRDGQGDFKLAKKN